MYSLTHGNAWSVYFKDPEGNRVELDFNLTDEEIIERTRKIVHQYPTAEPINQWRQRVADSIGLKDWKPLV